jgi:hypothetical protein
VDPGADNDQVQDHLRDHEDPGRMAGESAVPLALFDRFGRLAVKSTHRFQATLPSDIGVRRSRERSSPVSVMRKSPPLGESIKGSVVVVGGGAQRAGLGVGRVGLGEPGETGLRPSRVWDVGSAAWPGCLRCR